MWNHNSSQQTGSCDVKNRSSESFYSVSELDLNIHISYLEYTRIYDYCGNIRGRVFICLHVFLKEFFYVFMLWGIKYDMWCWKLEGFIFEGSFLAAMIAFEGFY